MSVVIEGEIVPIVLGETLVDNGILVFRICFKSDFESSFSFSNLMVPFEATMSPSSVASRMPTSGPKKRLFGL